MSLVQVGNRFRVFGEREAHDSSPRYERLSAAIAAEPALAEPLLAAPLPFRHATLFFAAVQHVLRHADHPLRGYYPTLGGSRTPDAGFLPAFCEFVAQHAEAVREICASHTTQTNEVRRAATLRPAFIRAAAVLAGGRPLALVELGTSAGLLLLADRFGFRYQAKGRTVHAGRAGATVMLDCAIVGERWPDVTTEPVVGSRLGVDLHPVSPDDASAVDWLRSCIWPEHTDRLGRLDAAFGVARAVRPRLVRADLTECLPGLLDAIPDTELPLVFAASALGYSPPAARARVASALAEVGRRRDLAVVVQDAADAGVRVFAADAPRGRDGSTAYALALVTWRRGVPAVVRLGECAIHGGWLSWAPREYAYCPGD